MNHSSHDVIISLTRTRIRALVSIYQPTRMVMHEMPQSIRDVVYFSVHARPAPENDPGDSRGRNNNRIIRARRDINAAIYNGTRDIFFTPII